MKLKSAIVGMISMLTVFTLAAGVASSATVLGSAWKITTDSAGTDVTVNANGGITIEGSGGWFSNENVVTDTKVDVKGIKLELSIDEYGLVDIGTKEEAGCGPTVFFFMDDKSTGYISGEDGQADIASSWLDQCDLKNGVGITFLRTAFPEDEGQGEMTLHAVVIGRKDDKKVTYVYYINDLSYLFDGRLFTLEVKAKDDGKLYIYIDGEELLRQVTDEDSGETSTVSHSAFDVTFGADGATPLARLGISNGSYGSANNTITLHAVNNVAANDFITVSSSQAEIPDAPWKSTSAAQSSDVQSSEPEASEPTSSITVLPSADKGCGNKA